MSAEIPIIDFRLEEVERGREISDEHRFIAGAELFDSACEVSRGGIRGQFPDFNEEQVFQELRRRIELGKRIRDGF